MRKLLLVAIIFLNVFFPQGFSVTAQANEASISIFNRENQATTQITDGDTIRIQITLPQTISTAETITFTVADGSLAGGSCIITSGNASCTTDSFASLGWYWNSNGAAQNTRVVQAKNNSGELIAQSNPITVAPRPVVLVHGFLSNWQTWSSYLQPNGFLDSLGLKGFAVGDGQVPGTLNAGNPLNPTGRTNTIAQNAEVLGQYISNIKKQTGASPMGGSNCSVLPAALGFFLPASIEIRESYMRSVFNQQITHRKGIEFYDLGGTAINDTFKSPCTDIPNDTVVAFGSINAISLQSSKIDDIHSDLTFSEKAFTDFVKPLLQKPADSFPLRGQPDPAPVASSDSPLEFTRVYTGHVDAGGSTELTINIEPNVTVAAFALYDASRSVTTVVRGASGNVIQLDPQTNGFTRVEDASSLFYLGYGFQNPRPGPWKVTVQATESTPANGTDFAISVYFIGGAKLQAASSTLIPRLNEKVILSANVSLNGQPLQISQAQAIIKNPNGQTETLDFPAGQNISRTWTPREPGTHAVDIVVSALAPDGTSIERTDFLAMEVQPNLSKFQISFNLVLLLTLVSLVLIGIFFGIIRLVRRRRR